MCVCEMISGNIKKNNLFQPAASPASRVDHMRKEMEDRGSKNGTRPIREVSAAPA